MQKSTGRKFSVAMQKFVDEATLTATNDEVFMKNRMENVMEKGEMKGVAEYIEVVKEIETIQKANQKLQDEFEFPDNMKMSCAKWLVGR